MSELEIRVLTATDVASGFATVRGTNEDPWTLVNFSWGGNRHLAEQQKRNIVVLNKRQIVIVSLQGGLNDGRLNEVERRVVDSCTPGLFSSKEEKP